MKRQKVIIKNSALPKVTKVVVESEPNLVAENIRKGVTILGVEGTYEDGVSGDLTPFRVGQIIKGVTIDPNAKSVDEIANWLNGLPQDTEFVVSETESKYDSIVYIQDYAGVKTLSIFESGSAALFFTEAVSAEGLTGGWYNFNDNTNKLTPMTEKTTINSNAYELTTVSPEFVFLNGIVIGAVEATNVPEVPQETLVPFASGQTINAIKVNTNAKTNDELNTFVAKALEGQGDRKTLVSDSVGTPLISIQGSTDLGYCIKAESDNSNNIFWVSKDLNLDSKFTFPSAGWYLVNEDTSSVEGVSGIVDLSFTATVTTSGNNDIAFNELNGTVFGVVKAN